MAIQGGTSAGSPVHPDWVGELEKLPQANGGVPPIVTSHSTGNNKEGIEGGIDNRGIEQTDKKDGYRKSPYMNEHSNGGGIHHQ